MSRIASVKETGEEISQADWTRFERAVQTEVEERGHDRPRRRGKEEPDASKPSSRGEDRR